MLTLGFLTCYPKCAACQQIADLTGVHHVHQAGAGAPEAEVIER